MTDLITRDVWGRLSDAARSSRRPALVAVAYFGQGASSLLRLPRGSRIVVDASEAAVKSGQTCPAELQKLVKLGVRVYSVPNLHAKVYVFDRRAFIGSANASRRSSGTLIEAMLVTTGSDAIAAARSFVLSQCVQELGPELLARLQEYYRPSRFPTASRSRRRRTSPTGARLELPNLRLAHLRAEAWPDDIVAADERGMEVAENRRQHPRTWHVDSFRWTGRRGCKVGDMLVMVTVEQDGRVLVSPPGNVLYTRRVRTSVGESELVYVELPERRRQSLDSLARRIGRGARPFLRRPGLVRNAAFARSLLAAFGSAPRR